MTRRRPNHAFTLTELLIVIGLIVLVIAIAVPAFKAMSGGRSVDAAQNQLAAVLGAARAEAIGLQKVRGVFFYVDPRTERVNAAIVQESDYRPAHKDAPPDPPGSPDYYLDLVPEHDPVALPVGVGLQGIDNADFSSPGNRKDDGYIGYNPMLPGNLGGGGGPPDPTRSMRVGGVILFDGFGRVINKFYGFHRGRDDTAAKIVRPTLLAELVGYLPTDTPPHYYLARQAVGGTGPMSKKPPQSLFGFVLYDAEAFRSQPFVDPQDPTHGEHDPEFDPAAGSYAGREKDEEKWLDQNGIPVLINRYNGTLVRGE